MHLYKTLNARCSGMFQLHTIVLIISLEKNFFLRRLLHLDFIANKSFILDFKVIFKHA